MGVIEWACPKCGQKQTYRAPNGSEELQYKAGSLCAACAEEEARVIPNDHDKKAEGSKARAR